MKKLMTMLAAVGLAFGLHADTWFTGSNFEIETLDSNYWTLPAAGTATLTEGSHDVISEMRPNQWKTKGNATNLVIKTTLGSPVVQSIKEGGTATMIGSGLYFDGLVNMTVFDKDDTIPEADLNNAKIGVYLQLAGDDDSATNFVVVAAGENGATNHYVCAGADLTPGWHRLTIKAISNIYATGAASAGFVVFVDKSPVNCEQISGIRTADLTFAAKKFADLSELFPSLGGDANQLTSIAYDGQGVIDEVTFTDDLPFDAAKDIDGYYVSFDPAKFGTVTVGEYSSDESPLEVIGEKPSEDHKVTISWTGAGDYIAGSKEVTSITDATVALSDSDLTLAAAKVISADGTTTNLFATLTGAVDAMTVDGTLKLLAAATEDITFTADVNVTLDVNGFDTKAIAGAEYTNGSLTLDNSSETVVIVDGKLSKCTSIANTKFKFNYSKNYNTMLKKCTITAQLPGDTKLVAEGESYWAIVDAATVAELPTGEFAIAGVAAGDKFAEGESIAFTVTPNQGFKVTSVTVNGNVVTDDSGYTYEVTAADVESKILAIAVTTEAEVTEVTVTLTKGTGIAAIQKDAVDVTEVKGEPGQEITVTLTAESTIALPVFKADGETCGQTYKVTIPAAAKTIAFTAIDATEGTDEEAAAALIDAGLDSTTVEKVGSAKALAAWWENAGEGATVAQINASNYLKASVKLNVALITEETVVEVASETFAATGSDLTFNVKVGEAEVTAENVKDYVKATTDVADWTKIEGTAVTVESGKVKVAAEGDKVFAKVVIPDDAK